MGLFKSKEEKSESNALKANDMIARGNYSGALSHFNKSVENGNNSPETMVLIAILKLATKYQSLTPMDYSEAINVLDNYPNVDVKFGVHQLNSTRIRDECELARLYYNVMQRHETDNFSEELGKLLIECGNKYQMQFGDEPLVMQQVFEEKVVTGSKMSLYPLAIGYETLAQSIKWTDPRKAAEYLQKASIYHSENNLIDNAAVDDRTIEKYSRTAHCWFCGKEVSGEDIHFVAMPSNITPAIESQIDQTSPFKTCGPSEIYVCRACFSAMEGLGKEFLKQGMEYTDQVGAALNVRILALEREIASLRVAIRR